MTESKLEQLNKRRRELEGSPDEVIRETRVVIPSGTGTVTSSTDDVFDGSEDTQVLNGSFMKKVLHSLSSNDDGPPLTTKAVRDLEKAQSEIVYSKTLIRVKFPDRVVIQGYFHPRHTMSDVYLWLATCLNSDTSYEYELYTSPPKTVLRRDDKSSLSDLCLVPAALIYLSWAYNGSQRSSDSHFGISGITTECHFSSYLNSGLLEQSDDKGNILDVNTPMFSYPQGNSLISKSSAVNISNTINSNIKMDIDDKAEVKSTNSSKNKPSWLKI